MPAATPLNDATRIEVLPPLMAYGWRMAADGRDALILDLKFKDFSQAWAAMSRIALRCEAMDHHPEWYNVYNRLSITLTTHSCNGLSSLDVALAQDVQTIAADQGAKVTLGP